jgi:hypothetical protein
LNRAGVTLVAMTRIDELDLPARRPRMDDGGEQLMKAYLWSDGAGPPTTVRTGWRRFVERHSSARAVLFINSFEYNDSAEFERAAYSAA